MHFGSVDRQGLRRWWCLIAALLAVTLWVPLRAWAVTAPGTVLSTSTSATYQDLGGISYATTSNTITTTVANEPILTVSTPVGQSVTAGMIVLDTFTLTNVGNASGNFNVAADATLGGTAASTTLDGYVLNAAPTGNCSVATPCALTTVTTGLQALLAGLTASTINGTITIGVEYNVNASVAINQTIQTSLTPTITYPIAGGTAAATSTGVTSTPTDTVVPDARLDMAASATQPSTTLQNITWTITANNGGGFAAHDSLAINNWLGSPGVFISVLIPTFAGPTLALQSAATCALSGGVSGATATLYYSTGSGWSTTLPSPLSNAVWIGCMIHSGTGALELPSAPSGSIGAGSVTTPQVTITFVTAQPSGTGSTTLGSVTNIANACAAGQAWATGTRPAVCSTIAVGTADGSLSLTAQEANTTPSNGTVPPGGASNTSASQAYVAPTLTTEPGTAVYVGPDTATQGNWHAASTPWTPYVYGSDGYSIVNGTTSNPSYATVTLGGSSEYTWESTSIKTQALYISNTSATRTGAQYFANNSAPYSQTIDVNITDGNTHQFALYVFQDGGPAIYDPILVTDQTHGSVLLFNIASDPTSGGTSPVYARWNISGHVRFTIFLPSNPTSANPGFDGYFFDPVSRSAVTSTNVISYAGTDTLTQGNWTPGSGGDGYSQVSATSYPSYFSSASSIQLGGTAFTWLSSTTDVRGPYTTPISGTRALTQVYGIGNFGFLFQDSDMLSHPLSLYFLDYGGVSSSVQTIYVSDPVTGSIADLRTISGFSNGTYVTWNMTGAALIYFVRTGATNATYSGAFWGKRMPSLTFVNAVSPTGNQPPGTQLTYTATLTNIGAASALNNYVTTAVPAHTDFKLASPSALLTGTGLTLSTVTYSNNNGTSYVYTPVSGTGGAAAGYDRTVTNVKWTFTGTLLQGAGTNTGSVSMIVQIQ
jgi:hypothetical protein